MSEIDRKNLLNIKDLEKYLTQISHFEKQVYKGTGVESIHRNVFGSLAELKLPHQSSLKVKKKIEMTHEVSPSQDNIQAEIVPFK